jgi:cellulase
MMLPVLEFATLLGAFASTAVGHGYVSGIVADGVYTEGWQVSFWYDIVNGVSIPQTPGWYEEELDLGFVPPDEYQYVHLRLVIGKQSIN